MTIVSANGEQQASGFVYSLSEIEAHARKAVRGAGFAWGYAEEAAKAVRLLAAYQLPGAVVLADYLAARAEGETFSGPVMTGASWSAAESTQALCPLLSGAVLCDNAQLVTGDGAEVVLTELSHPLLVLPYVALLARRLNRSLRLSWEGVELVCHRGRLAHITGDAAALATVQAGRLCCEVVESAVQGEEAGQRGQVISAEIWQALNTFACHTYVPATEASRRGAGPAD